MRFLTKERIALAIFFAMLLVSLASFVAYLYIGHNWNVAATTIDDVRGEMEGYTVILFDGQAPSIQEREDALKQRLPGVTSRDAQTQAAGDKPHVPNVGTQEEAEQELREQGERIDKARQNRRHELLDRTMPSYAEEGFTNALDDIFQDILHPLQSPESKDDLIIDTKPSIPTSWISSQEVRREYWDKGAEVLCLNTARLDQYSYGAILRCNGESFGVVSLTSKDVRELSRIQAILDRLKANKVDYLVVISPNRALAERLTGATLVISLADEGLFPMGETHQGVFYMDSPERGSVGAIFISPARVLSAKDVYDLG